MTLPNHLALVKELSSAENPRYSVWVATCMACGWSADTVPARLSDGSIVRLSRGDVERLAREHGDEFG